MLALVWLLYMSFGITAASLAPLVEDISHDLSLSSSQMGLILGAWPLTYIFVAYSMGTLVDRLGVRRAMAGGIAVVTVSLLLRAVAVDFFSLFAIVALFGVGGSIISIGAPKTVALWFWGRQRGLAAGLYTTAPIIGTIVVFSTANSLVVPLTGHWRLSFVAYGIIAVLATVVWWLLARDRPEAALPPNPTVSAGAPTEVAAPSRTFSSLLRERNVRVILLLSFAAFLMGHGIVNWLPTVLTDKGMTPTQAGFWASVPNMASVAGLLLIPALARYGYRSLTIALLLLSGAVSTIGIGLADGGPLLGGALAINGLSRGPIMPVMILVLMETPGIGSRNMGIAGGMFFAAAEVGGFSGPLLMGLLRDLTGTLFSGLVLLTVVVALFALLTPFISERRPAT